MGHGSARGPAPLVARPVGLGYPPAVLNMEPLAFDPLLRALIDGARDAPPLMLMAGVALAMIAETIFPPFRAKRW